MVHLDDMALFVEVVKLRSFRRAADSLGMPNSTLSRRIGGLEKAIGLRLLHRTTRKIELTEAGQVYYVRCKRIVDEARLLCIDEDGVATVHRVGYKSSMANGPTPRRLHNAKAPTRSLFKGHRP